MLTTPASTSPAVSPSAFDDDFAPRNGTPGIDGIFQPLAALAGAAGASYGQSCTVNQCFAALSASSKHAPSKITINGRTQSHRGIFCKHLGVVEEIHCARRWGGRVTASGCCGRFAGCSAVCFCDRDTRAPMIEASDKSTPLYVHHGCAKLSAHLQCGALQSYSVSRTWVLLRWELDFRLLCQLWRPRNSRNPGAAEVLLGLGRTAVLEIEAPNLFVHLASRSG